MVKLASARESRVKPSQGLSLLLIALLLIAVVNLHDLVAHLAGIDYRFPLMGYDTQFALVEFAVPVIQALGALLSFLGILFILIQEHKGFGHFKSERHALNLLAAGPALWVLGSIHNSCQIYERADGHVQILQQSVHIPFLIGSSLFFVGSILNIREQAGWGRHGLGLLSKTWVWIGIFGSLMLFIGGLTNVVKVFEMQQSRWSEVREIARRSSGAFDSREGWPCTADPSGGEEGEKGGRRNKSRTNSLQGCTCCPALITSVSTSIIYYVCVF
ncbi:hypothetical protein OIU84_002023 [Salix udensis]|uniref:Uncharacterized protein n=1 Tax=Salix udensis TaxID=889485 RepID=A0AAD6K839_9ROSI|nr:hypothetical protein OIU84_002023 [Salix udensis]